MLTIGLISLIFVTGASVYNIKQTERDLYNSLTAAAERASKPDGDKDKPEIGKDQPDRLAPTNVCVVKYTVDSFGATVVTTVSGNANLSADVVNKAAKAAAESAGYGQNSPRPQKKDGKLESYDLAYSVSVTPNGAYIAFADYDYLRSSTRRTLLVAGLVEISFLLAVFLLSVFLAKVAVKPVEKSIEEQKRFVADASHELKTPLAVISANNEILLSSASAEQKEWLNSSQEEISGMKDVINDMLTLAQNEAVCETEKTDADLSKILSGVTLQFEAVAYEKNVELSADIADGVRIKCVYDFNGQRHKIRTQKRESARNAEKRRQKSDFYRYEFRLGYIGSRPAAHLRAVLPLCGSEIARRSRTWACDCEKPRRPPRRKHKSNLFERKRYDFQSRIIKKNS